MHKTMQQKAAEAHNMCKLKGESMLDNQDRQLAFEIVYSSEEEALQAVEFFTQKAKSVESEPCQITHEILPLAEGCLLKMALLFSCQAELILFQWHYVSRLLPQSRQFPLSNSDPPNGLLLLLLAELD